MRYPFAKEFKFDFQGEELTAYFDAANNLIDVDTEDYDWCIITTSMVSAFAIEEYELFLKNQEAEAKDWENTKYHLNQQFKVF